MTKKRTFGIIPAVLLFLTALTLAAIYKFNIDSTDGNKGQNVGRRADNFNLPALFGSAPLSLDEISNHDLSILVFWASWCAECRKEMPILVNLQKENQIPIFGIIYRDKTEKAEQLLTQNGNPFRKVGVDDSGQTAVNWGIYGVPELFILKTIKITETERRVMIVYRHIGAIDENTVKNVILPRLR